MNGKGCTRSYQKKLETNEVQRTRSYGNMKDYLSKWKTHMKPPGTKQGSTKWSESYEIEKIAFKKKDIYLNLNQPLQPRKPVLLERKQKVNEVSRTKSDEIQKIAFQSEIHLSQLVNLLPIKARITCWNMRSLSKKVSLSQKESEKAFKVKGIYQRSLIYPRSQIKARIICYNLENLPQNEAEI